MDRNRSSRGQAMAEIAILLPILLLILLFAVDFGRVFFGWVGVQNASRIGASWAAQDPNADWGDPNDSTRLQYEAQIRGDAAAINCDLPENADMLPVFPSGTTPGDPAVVQITCDFQLITPLLAPLFGGMTVPIAAESTFPVRARVAFDGPSGPGNPADPPAPTCREIPDLDEMLVPDARNAWTAAGFTGAFFPATGQANWVVTAQWPNPFALPGACVSPSTSMTVDSEQLPPPPCEDPDERRVPQLVGLTVSQARTSWTSAQFTGGFTPSSGHGNSTVLTQTTNASSQPGDCMPLATTISVTHGSPPPPPNCFVPNFIGSHSGGAQSTWTSAGFTTTVSFRAAGGLPYIINEQNRVSGAEVPCDSSVQLGPG